MKSRSLAFEVAGSLANLDRRYSFEQRRAFMYSRFNCAMFVSLIFAGQAASHSPVFVQFPKCSASMVATMFRTRLLLSD